MKTKKETKILLLTLTFSLVAFCGSICSFRRFEKTSDNDNSKWLSSFSDSTSLGTLSLPGSHYSGALLPSADLIGQCQDATIEEQLNFGVRFLDLSLLGFRDDLVVSYEGCNQNLYFDTLLFACCSFLKEHSSETILLSICQDSDPVLCTKKFDALILEKIEKNKSYFYTERSLPILGRCRGKMVLLSRYDENSVGIDLSFGVGGWQRQTSASQKNTFDIKNQSSVHVQDHSWVDSNENKWEEIIDCFSFAKTNPDYLSLNFLSGYLNGSFPRNNPTSVASFVNKKIFDVVPEALRGVVVFDFVTRGLSAFVIQSNAYENV